MRYKKWHHNECFKIILLLVKRPPVGCRILACTHLPNILPAVITDLCDWQEEVCIKASQLLYNLILNAEEGITQHIPMIIDGLIKCFKGVERRVVTEVMMLVCALEVILM